MTHRLTYAKNYCNRTLIVKVIVENVVTCFWGDTVYTPVERGLQWGPRRCPGRGSGRLRPQKL